MDEKKQLTKEQHHILREAGTEKPFSGVYNDHFEEGVYRCAGCDNLLFRSEQKYRSGCGWPAFSNAQQGAIKKRPDTSHGMLREEVICAKCQGHLGHVFNDGPAPTNTRFCINSAALEFKPEQ